MIRSTPPRLLVLALAVSTAPLARGAADCLTGDATLGDQRAIASVRAQIDAACPCAESRGKQRRCAKDVLAAAADGGALRPECERTVKRIVKGTACGGKVACGRVKPGADVVASCSVRKPAACRSKPRFTRTACAATPVCADVVDWTAGTCSDVRASGPYPVGVRTLTLVKDSVVSPGTPRQLDTLVWYPTTAEGPATAFGGQLDAPVDSASGAFPLVLFSHGSCGYPAQSVFLTATLASRGYVVAAPPHPPNTVYEGLATCGAPATLANAAIERPADVRFVLDEMLARNADPSSPFHGVIDPERVGMMGHSFGGYTTYRVATLDPRIKVAVPLAPAVGPTQEGLTLPSLTMIGGIDSVVDNDAVRAEYERSAGPKWLVEIAHAGHYAFSGLCFPSPDCMPPVTLAQDEAHAVVLRWVLPFLEWRLRGDDTFAAFFATPVPPGVVVAQE